MVDVQRLMRPHLVTPKTYASVDPSEELARKAAIDPSEVIRLNANENPFGPVPQIAEALRNLPLHLYPDPNQRRLREALSGYAGQPPENILAGAGSDELIDLLIRLFLAPAQRAIDCDPTFGMYSFCARVADAEVVSVPRGDQWEVDVTAVAGAMTPETRIIFLASPNNPTGNTVPEDDVIKLLELGLIVVVDETYHEFAGRTLAGLLPRHENLVIIRSFSKWAGIAGLRIGYMLASPTIINHLVDIKQPYNVSVASEAAAMAAIEHRALLMANVRILIEQRKRLEATLEVMDGVCYFPSEGNFLLCSFERHNAIQVYEALAREGIFVRYFSHPRLQEALRISAGTPDETDRLIVALRKVMRRNDRGTNDRAAS